MPCGMDKKNSFKEKEKIINNIKLISNDFQWKNIYNDQSLFQNDETESRI